jgi:hypothetical protein
VSDELFDGLNRLASSAAVQQVRFCFNAMSRLDTFTSSAVATSLCSGPIPTRSL